MYGASSTLAGKVDNVFFGIVAVTVVLLLLVTALMIFFAVRYSRKRHPQAVQIHGNLTLEILWSVIPTILVMGMF